jgi:hypothetical protein
VFTSLLRNLVLAAGLLVAAAVISAQAEGQEQLTPTAALFPGDAEPNHREGAETHATKEEGHDHEAEHHAEEPADLFPCDFFRTGWDEPFEERPREGRAPRFNLFKSRQGFLERIALADYVYTNGLENRTLDDHLVIAGLEWAFNRRLEIEVGPFYEWRRPSSPDARRGDGLSGEYGALFQLLDTADWAFNLQVHAVTPETHLDVHQTELAFALAGFNDLTHTLGLRRVGLYYDAEYVALIGPRGAGDERRPANLMRYDVSVAKTLVEPTVPLVTDFTVFVEAFGETELDGSNSGRTLVTFTPGIRFNPTGREEKARWVQAGVEFPVTRPRPFNERVLLAVIHDF